MGWVGSVLDPTRTQPFGIRWRVEGPETDRYVNWLSQFRVRVWLVQFGWLLETAFLTGNCKNFAQIYKF